MKSVLSTIGILKQETALQDLIVKEKLTADQIHNCDETGLYWRALPTKISAVVNEGVALGRKKMKDRVTILGCANASGSHRVKLTLVGKSKIPRCFKNINKFLFITCISKALG
ncbi:Jerky -like [Araneus ventricosus]|uniref:Jerky-like n=1 Tax=Araneus ventricosus TaxID=182803 RepID=A0A4Y2CE72_ARAVE|nr:Jerky -like [Araneus ventricosus]